jgi:nitronate monooxygenase
LRYNVSTPWATMDGDWEAGPLYAGASVELIHSVEPASQLLAQIDAEAETILRQSTSYLLEESSKPTRL